MAKQQQSKRSRGNKIIDACFTGCLVVPPVGMLIASIYCFSTGSVAIGGLLLTITAFVSVVAINQHGKYRHDVRQQEAEGELDKHIQTALKKMESVGGYYTDEDSANQQLCLLLKELMPGTDVRLMKPGSAEGDIRVANTIIEGKLDLETKDEMDRLVGQLQDYCSSTPYQIRVVVYGKLRPDFRRRIEGLPQYYDRILIHHISGIKTRKPAGKTFKVIQQTRDDKHDS